MAYKTRLFNMSFSIFFIVYDELDFPAGMCRIKKGENEKVRHAIENLERMIGGGGGSESACYILDNEAAITCRA